MKLKLDEAGHAVLSEGKPVYIADDGKEFPLDGGHLYGRVRDLTTENTSHRQAKETAEAALKKFEGIDPEDARKAIGTVKNLDDKKLVDAGEVEKVKLEAIRAVEDRYKPIVEERDKLQSDLYGERIGGAFARSKFIAEKVAVPADMVQAAFGKSFKIEDGKTVAYGPDGNKLFSRSRPGEAADFEEALELLVDQYPHKATILKGTGAQGGGANNGQPQNSGGDLSKLSPVDRINAARAQQ